MIQVSEEKFEAMKGVVEAARRVAGKFPAGWLCEGHGVPNGKELINAIAIFDRISFQDQSQ